MSQRPDSIPFLCLMLDPAHSSPLHTTSNPLILPDQQPSLPDAIAHNVHPMQTRLGISKSKQILSLHTTTTMEPISYTQAAKGLRWRQTMAEEFNALIENHTWI